MGKAEDIVNEMFSKGCIPDVVTYTCVFNGLCQERKVEQAKRCCTRCTQAKSCIIHSFIKLAL